MVRSIQLDLFRGVAALLMVLNHAGVHWLAPEDATSGLAGLLVFLGSAAPALFFFATGAGMGLSRRAALDWPSLLRKVVLLLIADAALNWAEGRWLGLDFFGFCALSMLAVAGVVSSKRPRLTAVLVLVVVVALRYGDAPLVMRLLPSAPWLGFVTGVEGFPDVSYPLCPWLVFPLAGYLVGSASSRLDSARAQYAAAAAALLLLGAARAMALHGAAVHRWGSVSAAYFVFAVGFVGACWVLARVAVGARGNDFLRLRGPASLLVVPLHYAVIQVGMALLPTPWPLAVWGSIVAALCLLVLPACRGLADILRRVASAPRAGVPLVAAIVFSMACCGLAADFSPGLACWLVACLSQTVIAANLARPSRAVHAAVMARTL